MTHYIPPHLRNKQSELESEAITRLKKQLKGLLNRCAVPSTISVDSDVLPRMSEQNLSSIIDSFEELYRSNRRHGLCFYLIGSYMSNRYIDMTSSITNLVIEGIASHSILLDSYVVLHAALISSLYKIIGVEFGTNVHRPFYLRS